MKLTKMEEDLRVHQKLDDEPNDVGGLTAQELKAKFDQAGLALQSYLNETHLPEEETAVAEAVETAKKYTDEKVAALRPGDMSAAVYDTQKRQEDVFQFAEAKAREAKEDTSKQGYLCAGDFGIQAHNMSVQLAKPAGLLDLKGMWPGSGKYLVAPAGAKAVIVWMRVTWARSGTAKCFARLTVNDEEQSVREGPYINDGASYNDTVMLAAAVKGGDYVSLEIEGRRSGSTTESDIYAKEFLVEFIL